MAKIARSVGRGGVNLYNDVITIQKLLNKQRLPGVTGQLKYDGDAGPETITRIEIFQMNIVKMPKPDGRIDPGGKTMAKLTGSTTQSKSSAFGKLTEADFQAAAKALGSNVEVAMVKAIAKAESGGRSGFNAAGLPVIAYEGHYFRRLTNKKYDQTHPLLSYEYGKKAGVEWKNNNQNQVTAWATLEAAMKLDRAAAYQSCSWGMFQVMGAHYKTKCGFSSVDAFVEATKAGEAAQLKAFVEFCKNTSGLKEALADKNFKKCAELYNGEDYGNYAELIGKAYKTYSGE